MNILVVEDDLVSGTLLTKLLTKGGHAATHVLDGEKALIALEEDIYRVVITDWMMPNMDGLTLCRRIRALDLPQYVYIILLTAKDDTADAVAGLEAGADDYIVKPFDKDELMARIRVGQRLTELEDKYRQTSEKLSQSEKMAAVGHLAAGVAHEINNPIGFITSNLKTLTGYYQDLLQVLPLYQNLVRVFDQSIAQNKLDATLPQLLKKAVALEKQHDIDFVMEDMEELVHDCANGADRIKSIVHEMRYFAHPDQQQFQPEPMEQLVAEVMDTFAPAFKEHIDIVVDMNDLPKVHCNGEHIKQVLHNLVKNAEDAMEEGGTLSISSRCHKGHIEVMVADTGKGIPAEDKAKVFNPFFTTQPVGQGVGLGLTTAMNILRMHKGDIALADIPGFSTAFSITLPVHDEPLPENQVET